MGFSRRHGPGVAVAAVGGLAAILMAVVTPASGATMASSAPIHAARNNGPVTLHNGDTKLVTLKLVPVQRLRQSGHSARGRDLSSWLTHQAVAVAPVGPGRQRGPRSPGTITRICAWRIAITRGSASAAAH
jgi:hypothetical protein